MRSPKRTGTGSRVGRRAVAVGVTAAAVAGLLTVAAPPAAAEPCDREITGEPLPEGLGPHPLIDRLGLWQAWDLATGEGVEVALIDSGVDARHPVLRDAVERGSEYTTDNTDAEFERSTPEPVQDCEGHGTALAGLIAARRTQGDRVTGVAPGAIVHPVRMDEGVEGSTVPELVAAIDDAVASGADVLLISLAVPADDEDIRQAVARAVGADVVVVAPAGDEGDAEVPLYPAAYNGVLAVGSVGDDGQPLDTSTPGTWVDLAGYGGELPVVAPGGEGYRVEAGSGVAAAQVAGAAALVRSRFPGLSALEVAQRLTASANPVGGGRDPRTGAGLVDPFGALTHLGDDGAGGDDSGTARAGRIPVQALPRPEPLMSDTVATALAWAGVLLLAVVLGLLAAPAVRRAAGRGWRAGPAPGGEDAARGGAANRPVPPPGGRLDWLDGSDVPRPGATRQPMGTLRNRTR